MKQNSTAKNIAQIVALTIIATVGFHAACRVYEVWKKRNKWLAAYDRICREVEEAPNPMYIGKEDRD